MEFDPQVLVALAAVGIERVAHAVAPTPHVQTTLHDHDTLPVLVSPSSAGTIRTVPDEPNFPIGDSIVGEYEIDDAVLDAFANIVVSDPDSQFVAVALEMDVSKQIAVLTITDSVGPDLIPYLQGIWRLMCIMSNRCEQRRQEQETTVLITVAVEPWRTELVRRIYLYCKGKDLLLLQNQWGSLRGFVSQFEPREDDLPGDHRLKRKLTDSVYALGATYSLLRNPSGGHPMTDKMWRDLICLMDATVSDIGNVLDEHSLCEEWAKSLGYNTDYFLRRILEKLITQHRHILVLLDFAHSPHSHSVLQCPLTIRAIPCQSPAQIYLPSTSLSCQFLIESVCGESLITDYAWLNQQVTKFCGSHRGGSQSITHGVCALIASLDTSPRISNPSSNYLGVSALTCGACHAWIQAFNSLGGRQYRTRGTTGDWCFPWALPTLKFATEAQKVQLSTHMVTLVAAEYVAFWTAKGKLYSLSECPRDATAIGMNTATRPHAAETRDQLVRDYRHRSGNGRW